MASSKELPQLQGSEFSQSENQVEREVVDVVRTLPFSLRSMEDLRAQLERGFPGEEQVSLDEINLTSVVLIEKSDKSLPSSGKFMPLGGKVLEGETVVQAAHRKQAEESLVHTVRGDWWQSMECFDCGPSFSYTIRGNQPDSDVSRKPRRVCFLPILALPLELTRAVPRNPELDKISEFIALQTDDFEELIRNGEVKLERITEEGVETRLIQPVGHLMMSDTDDISFSGVDADSEKKRKNIALERLIEQSRGFDKYVKDELVQVVESVRKRNGIETETGEVRIYHKDEIIQAFEILLVQLALRHDNIQQQRAFHEEGNMNSLRPPPGLDALAFPWLVSEEGFQLDQMHEILFHSPSRNVSRNLVRLTNRFKHALRAVEGEEVMSVKKGAGIEYLRSKLQGMNTLDRNRYVQSLEGEFLDGFSRRWGVDAETIKAVMTEVDQFFRFLVEQSMQAYPDKRVTSRFQAHQQFNEVTNAGLTRIFLLALGFDPFRPDEKNIGDIRQRQRQFEAGRKLAYLGRGIEAYQRYQEIFNNGNAPIEAVLGDFYSGPVHSVEKVTGNAVVEVTHREVKDVNGRSLHIYVDEKPPKDFPSFLRKSFFEPTHLIRDVFSRNFVLVSDDGEDGGQLRKYEGDSLEEFTEFARERIKVAQEFRESLCNHFTGQCENYGKVKVMINGKPYISSWDVLVETRKDAYSSIQLTPKELDEKEKELAGQRPGSRAGAIIREKFYIHMVQRFVPIQSGEVTVKDYFEEIIIYPFENFIGTPFEGKLWGHDEKIEDDATGGYNFRRLTERDVEFPDIPSLYEMNYPPHLFGPLAEGVYVHGDQVEDGPNDHWMQRWRITRALLACLLRKK